MRKVLSLFCLAILCTFLIGCTDLDRLDKNVYLSETVTIDDEYVFKVLKVTESKTYINGDSEFDSKYENGLFLTLTIELTRKTLEKPTNNNINSKWFKLKKGVGFTIWKSSWDETISANAHIDALESSLIEFTIGANENKEFTVVFELGEKYLDTDRILTLEIDRPWSGANAKEIVLIQRPNEK